MVEDRLSFAAELFQVQNNPDLGMWIIYGITVVLSILAYKLGFSIKLPVFKSILIYIFLILGCTILTFLAIFLPVVESLVVIVAVLLVYRIRRWLSKREEANVTPKA